MELNGTTYHDETPKEVAQALEDARAKMQRVRIFYGDRISGRDWCEENDVTGRIGRSCGPEKVPILSHHARSIGGGAILDHCIVRLQIDGREVWRHANYGVEFELKHEGPGDLRERVYADGVPVANFRTEPQARRWMAFMRGERRTK